MTIKRLYLYLIIAICLLYSGNNIEAQTDTIIQIPDIKINDQRIQLPFSQSNRTIHFLTRADIEKLPVQSINELLAYLPGVDIRNRGIKGSQADLSLRGSTFEQVLVMIKIGRAHV